LLVSVLVYGFGDGTFPEVLINPHPGKDCEHENIQRLLINLPFTVLIVINEYRPFIIIVKN
jgi:hypothetical protein